ncbi:MAG: hypothetical protein ACTHOG_06680 [Marmoricola sp.]
MARLHPFVIRGPLLAAGAILGAGLIGYLLNHMPATQRPEDFWVGNLSAPFLVVPFAMAWIFHANLLEAVWTGAAAGVAEVCGFYLQQDLDMNAGFGWLFSAPWIAYGAAVGVVAGGIAYLLRHHSAAIVLGLVGVVLMLEPLAYASKATVLAPPTPLMNIPTVSYPSSAVNLTIWGFEFALGAAAAVVALVLHRKHQPSHVR